MITQGLEDYLEIIYNKTLSAKDVKAVDIAKEFNISRSSVSEALIRLADKDLIVYEGRKGIKITKQGKIEAQKVIKKHKILYDFFSDVLDINKSLADENACKIEHVIDSKIIKQIKSFTDFCRENSINKQYREKKNDR